MYLLIPNMFLVDVCYAESNILNIKDKVILRNEECIKIFINQNRNQIIGVSFPTTREARWGRDKEFMERYSNKNGIDIIIKDADTDIERQKVQVEELIRDGINILILAPTDSELIASMVENAHKAGIKVIAYDRFIKNANVDLYVTYDSLRVGEIQGRFLIGNAPTGNYIILSGDPRDNNSLLLKEGAMKYIKPLVNKGDIKIIADVAVENWSPQNAYNIVKNLLMTNNKVDAIVAPNDATAGGVIKALEENGLDGKVFVTGQDADLDAIKRIIKGTQSMTVFKDSSKLGKIAIDSALKLLKGEGIDVSRNINNGKFNVPVIDIEPVLVNKNNIQKVIIDSGYLNKNEIYKS